MKKVVILGAGTAGTMMANHLNHELDKEQWSISIIDEREEHYYQPGYLFLPFDIYQPEDIVKSIDEFIPKGVTRMRGKIDRVVPKENHVLMADERKLYYDILIVATGAKIAPEETEGMQGAEWQKSVFDFYTFEGALALRTSCGTGRVDAWWCTSPRCPSSVPWHRWSSPSWLIPISSTKTCATRWRSPM